MYCQGNKKQCYDLIQPFPKTVLFSGKAVLVEPWSQEGATGDIGSGGMENVTVTEEWKMSVSRVPELAMLFGCSW